MKGVLGPDLRHISVIAESTLKLFPAHGRFQLLDSEVTTIFFDYEGRNACVAVIVFPIDTYPPAAHYLSQGSSMLLS